MYLPHTMQQKNLFETLDWTTPISMHVRMIASYTEESMQMLNHVLSVICLDGRRMVQGEESTTQGVTTFSNKKEVAKVIYGTQHCRKDEVAQGEKDG